jgi:outer membrane protein, adhesin transport system
VAFQSELGKAKAVRPATTWIVAGLAALLLSGCSMTARRAAPSQDIMATAPIGSAVVVTPLASRATATAPLVTGSVGEGPLRGTDGAPLALVPPSAPPTSPATATPAPAPAPTAAAPTPAASPAAPAPAAAGPLVLTPPAGSPAPAPAPTSVAAAPPPAAAAPNPPAKPAPAGSGPLALMAPDPAKPPTKADAAPPPPRAPDAPPPASSKAGKTGPRMSLPGLIEKTITEHPQIGMAGARIDEAEASVDAAKSTRRVQLEGRVGVGQSTVGTYDNRDGLVNEGGAVGAARVDATVSMRQRLLDFGRSKNDISRSQAAVDAERYRRLAKIEEIAWDATKAYLTVLEHRELLSAAEANVAAHRRLAALVEANQRDGNGTVADVNRVAAKLVEAESMRSDLNAALEAASDKFRRLTKRDPGNLDQPPNFAKKIPPSPEAATALLTTTNPGLLAIEAGTKALEFETKTASAEFKPRIDMEIEATSKNYMGADSRTEIDMRGMVVLRHKLSDGGARRSAVDQLNARKLESQLRYIDTRDEAASDIRQFYRTMRTSRGKLSNLKSGVESSSKVIELYVEQFKGGKRTVFELLDSQTALFMAQRDLIQNQFDERRAIYGVLRGVGVLAETLLDARGR